jgi:hypothetical protein
MVVVKKLFWNKRNVAHIWRHKVTPTEVEQACRSRHVTFETYGKRILLVGLTNKARYISIVLASKGVGVWLPITARPASRKERRLYKSARSKEVYDQSKAKK